MKRTFLSYTDHLSIWDVAHRWVGVHPDDTNENKLPVEVKDVLFTMMRAQTESRLKVADSGGFIFRDATFYPHWSEFQPFSDQNWDGTPDHQRVLYFQATNANLVVHDEYISKHHGILSGTKPANKKYLSSVHVDRDNLAEWACKEGLPFPTFWFSKEEKTEIEAEWEKYRPYVKQIQAFHSNNIPVTEEMEEQILADLELPKSDDSKFRAGRLKVEDIDLFWESRMDAKQRTRILCRYTANKLWSETPDRTIEDISNDELIQEFCGGKYYAGKDTIGSWIKDLDPRSADKKRGPKPKK